MDRLDRLSLSASLAAAMLAHARAELPNEACGLVAGSRTSGTVTAFHPARNELASPWRFSLHREDLVRLVLDIESSGENLLAIFHSHVAAPAEPSPSDRRGAGGYPGVLHLVASLAPGDPVLRAWDLTGESTREIELRIA